ncbi:hypothetical protein M406DRAFT_55826, partial [Cryphonectria parasitica EP155]
MLPFAPWSSFYEHTPLETILILGSQLGLACTVAHVFSCDASWRSKTADSKGEEQEEQTRVSEQDKARLVQLLSTWAIRDPACICYL